jgi:hypothetical protein
MDFRLPKYRREVFMRFYEFHLKHGIHPGCVYFIFPYLFEKLNMTTEQKLWFCFLNGNTQNPATTLVIFDKFRDFQDVNKEFNTEFEAWFNWHYGRLLFDLDRRHHKKFLPKAIQSYKAAVGKSQEAYFSKLLDKSPGENFTSLYDAVTSSFYGFGRLSTWSYSEYLRIAGVSVEPPDLRLRDIDGSRSHRNGLAKVLGRDDLDYHHSNPGFDGEYSEPVMAWLEEEAALLLRDTRERMESKHYINDVNNFTLESALCTFKSFFRVNRRYPGVYVDMLSDRLRDARRLWPKHDILGLIEDARRKLPPHLLQETKPHDVGLKPEKQNHFIRTGQLVTMGYEDPAFRNDYDESTIFK